MRQPSSSPCAEDATPPCPICLTHIEDVLDRAVVLDCLHVFCVPCISRWAKLRRECPLCKGFFQAFIHDIVSAADFKERRLSPLRTQDSKDAAGSEDAIQALLQDAREQYSSWQVSQPRHRHHGSAHRSSNPERQGLSEPRPYYFRLQRNLAARAGSDAYCQAAVPAAAPDQTLEWRRSIYTRKLWALPIRIAGSGGTPPPNASAPAGEQRLQDWVARELQALLQQEDVLIVKGLVLSLVRSHGLAVPPHSSGSGSSQRHVRPADALRLFLPEHAQHFWHELRNFAVAPFTIITYDRTVRYGSPEQAAGSGQGAEAAAGVGSASRDRRSRWDVQLVRHARPSASSRSRRPVPAAPAAAQREAAERRGSEAAPAQPAAPAAEADRHGVAAGGNGAAQSAAELSALRSRALQSISGPSSPEPADRQHRQKQRCSLSRSPARLRRQRHCSRSTSPSEPQHRKRHARRQERKLEVNEGSRQAPTAAETGDVDDERWVME